MSVYFKNKIGIAYLGESWGSQLYQDPEFENYCIINAKVDILGIHKSFQGLKKKGVMSAE